MRAPLRARARVETLYLREAFVSRRGTTPSVRQLFVELEWNGAIGLGAALLPREQADWPRFERALDGRMLEDPGELLRGLWGGERGPRSLLSATDMALEDLAGKLAKQPLHLLWGAPAQATRQTALTLGWLPDEVLVERARALADWPILKLKMTANEDLDKVALLRRVYGGRIWVDGNGLWDVDGARSAAGRLADCGVELLEQPIAPGSPERLRKLRGFSPVRIVADEDCSSFEDLEKLPGCVDVVNIKLAKCGSLSTAAAMARRARAAGLGVMLGCKTESALGVTAIAQLAGWSDYLDLDGHLDLVDDPYSGIEIERGVFGLPSGAGLGATPKLPAFTGPSDGNRMRSI